MDRKIVIIPTYNEKENIEKKIVKDIKNLNGIIMKDIFIMLINIV